MEEDQTQSHEAAEGMLVEHMVSNSSQICH